ncbi:RING finger protein [Myxococcota bacterium]
MPPAFDAFPATSREAGKRCAICQTTIGDGEEVGRCSKCDTPFHVECWDENGGCATYGCELMPETVKPQTAEVPDSYWGQQDKQCPRCGSTIKVAALRCRHCGATFESRAPVSPGELAASHAGPDLGTARMVAVLVFITGLVPCTAPLTLVFGSIWYLASRPVIAKLPSTHRVMMILGLAAALATTLFVIAAAIMMTLGPDQLG